MAEYGGNRVGIVGLQQSAWTSKDKIYDNNSLSMDIPQKCQNLLADSPPNTFETNLTKWAIVCYAVNNSVIITSLPPLDPNQYSWGENYAGSSGLMSVSPDMNPMQRARSGTVSLQE